MNRKELKKELDLLEIEEKLYSLNGELIPDALIMYNSYQNWEVFYLDERGERHKKGIFSSEDQACQYIFKELKKDKEIKDKYFK